MLQYNILDTYYLCGGMARHDHEHHHHHHPGHAHPPAVVHTSLLRLSLAERLGAAGVVIALLWGAAYWAM
jgi:hypothetical protein